MQFLKLDNMAPALGVGQTWVDVTSQRVLGTTYINNTGRPISVNSVISNNTTTYYIATINGITKRYNFVTDGRGNISFIVPPNSTYLINVESGTPTSVCWMELR